MSPINYGEVETSTVTDGTTTDDITKYYKGEPVTHTKRTTQSVFAPDRKTVLAHFLRLVDKLDDPKISDITFSCHVKSSTGRYDLETSWKERVS